MAHSVATDNLEFTKDIHTSPRKWSMGCILVVMWEKYAARKGIMLHSKIINNFILNLWPYTTYVCSLKFPDRHLITIHICFTFPCEFVITAYRLQWQTFSSCTWGILMQTMGTQNEYIIEGLLTLREHQLDILGYICNMLLAIDWYKWDQSKNRHKNCQSLLAVH